MWIVVGRTVVLSTASAVGNTMPRKSMIIALIVVEEQILSRFAILASHSSILIWVTKK
jgi:hypothetical protein